MEVRVSMTEAAASLDQLVERVNAHGDVVIIERDGKAVGRLVPPTERGRVLTREDIAVITDAVSQLDDEWADAVEEAIKLGNTPMSAESPWDR
jgi:antitoxin (DNA-binding transcriptional repressor) of toxin-antitoxin stability system